MTRVRVDFGGEEKIVVIMSSAIQLCSPTCIYIPTRIGELCKLWDSRLQPAVFRNMDTYMRCNMCKTKVIE